MYDYLYTVEGAQGSAESQPARPPAWAPPAEEFVQRPDPNIADALKSTGRTGMRGRYQKAMFQSADDVLLPFALPLVVVAILLVIYGFRTHRSNSTEARKRDKA